MLVSFVRFGRNNLLFAFVYSHITINIFSVYILYILSVYIYLPFILQLLSCLVHRLVRWSLYLLLLAVVLLYVPEHEARLVIFIYIFRRHNPTRYVCDFFQ